MSRETMAFNRPPPPLPPHDPELRITIERMADYVAQYGPEGEEKARQEHHGNPQFEFLFGGKFADYYQYSIHMSVESRRGPQVPQPAVPPLNTQQAAEVEQITSRIEQLRREINESEMNLKAQEDSMPMQKEAELSKQVSAAENEKVAGYLANAKLDVSGFDEVLYLLNSPKASKDAIHSTKKWIFDNCTTDQQREVILMFLLNKVKDPCSNDCFRLNILYLINDWAYHCQRKKQDPVTQMLSRYVPQMYAFTVESSNDPAMQPKLEKLIGVWEGHKYFNDQCFKQLRNPAHIYQTAKTAMFAEHSKLAANIDVQFQALFAGYQQQHTNFVHHNQQQINSLESQLYSVKHGSQMPNVPPPQGPSQRRSRFDQQTRQEEGGGFGRFFPTPTAPTKSDDTWRDGRPPLDKPPPDGDDIDGHPFDEDALIPQAPYYALPAGIMVPQMPFENLTYGALDPSTLRMPPPLPPSQRLIDAMDAFYTRPVNFDPVVFGPRYEQDMLADFFDRKLRLKKIYEEKLKAEGKTLDDVIVNKMSAEDVRLQEEDREAVIAKLRKEKKKEAERRRRSTSSTRGRSHSRSRSRSRSRRRSRSSSYSSSRSSSRSSRSKTRSPVRRSRSRSASPRRTFTKSRSPTPPMFGRPSFNMPPAPLGGDNKGAMLMQKMGWSGKGLGAQESGITEPVHAGEVRDRSDMFKGLGSRADPYEQFRKMRSGSYRDRNVAAAEERDRLRKEYM